jgi:glycosyltransferase family protein
MKKTLLRVYYQLLKFRDKVINQYNRYISHMKAPPAVKDTDKTLEKLIENKISMSRFGDGEFSLMRGESLLFQPYHEKLAARLKEIIKSEKENHIVCIPNVFSNIDWATETASNYWNKYLNLNRNRIYKLLNMKKQYYDTQVTRLYIDLKNKNLTDERFRRIKILWKNRDVVIVEGVKSRLGIGNNLFNEVNSIQRIICPAQNAFAKYDEILNEVQKYEKSKLILIALGPTATVLAYDLSKLGYQALDIGHIDIEYEWFLQKAVEKAPIKNKYIGEVPNGTNVEDIINSTYEKQVIRTIL